MTTNDMMPTLYHCPRCQTFQVKERQRTIYCFKCELTFDKKFLKLLSDEDILSNEELEGFIEIFLEDPDDASDMRLIP